jgi:hypothetical protein
MAGDSNEEGPPSEEGVRDWLGARCEDLLGRLAQGLADDSTINAAITRAFEARGKATQAQQNAMGFLNIPTAADVERLTQRMRSVSQRLDAIEDSVARIEAAVRAEQRASSDAPAPRPKDKKRKRQKPS